MTTREKIILKLLQAEQVRSTITLDMKEDAFNHMLKAGSLLIQEAIDMREEAFEANEITASENVELGKMTTSIILTEVKDKF